MSVITQANFALAALLLFVNHPDVFAQAPLPTVSFVQASNVSCKVGRPNVKPGETVTWQGQCADGLARGAGVAQWSQDGKPTLRFEGTFAGGLLDGKGKMTTAEGDRYEGDYRNGMRHGYGIYGSADGSRYEGEYRDNQRNGTGVVISATGQRTRGIFKDGTVIERLPAAESSATARTTATPTTETSGAAGLVAKGGQSTAIREPINDSANQSRGSSPIPLPGHPPPPGAKAHILSVASPWGKELHMNCSHGTDGETVVPEGLDPKRSVSSGKYALANLPDDALLRFLSQVESFIRKTCADVGFNIGPNARVPIYLFADALPARFGSDRFSVPVYAYRDDRYWNVTNNAAYSYARQQEQEKAAAAQQRAESERQIQEAERRRVAEKAEQERLTQAKQRQEQAAAAQAEAQKKAADSEKVKMGRVDKFAKKHSLLNKKPKGLYANPFAFEGDRLFLVVAFEQMQSATSGMFYLPDEGILIVNDVPKGAFVKKSKILLAAKVLGNVRFDGVVGGLLQVHGMVPNLKFLGAIICDDDSCDQMDEK